MNFISIEFILLLLISTILYYILPKKFRFLVLVCANIYFYIKSAGIHAIYLLISIVSIYLAGLFFSKLNQAKLKLKELKGEEKETFKANLKHKRKLVLWLTIALNLGLLLVLKYDNFFIELFNGIFKTNISLFKFILPLGISYYTLEAISYIVDTYNQKYEPTKNFFKVFLYLSFFPLMVEGPITRFNELDDQIMVGHDFDYQRFCNSFLRITWGFVKKLVIADRIGVFVDTVFQGGHTGIVVLVGIILYVMQIYTEFSGAMDIVLGSANMFGITLPENFNAPLFSKSINEFWRRWHITLGTWLKDYIFYPISLSKFNLKLSVKAHQSLPKSLADTIGMAVPLFMVWFVMGFWHGASFKYILYGLYYYLIMLLGMLLKPFFNKIVSIFKIKTDCFSFHLFQIIRTLFFVTIGMTIFRAATFNGAFAMLGTIFKSSSESVIGVANGGANILLTLVMFGIIFILDFLKYRGVNVINKLNEQNLIFKYLVYLAVLFILLIFGIYGYGYNPSSFIYGEF
jgi:alginate O-acetyltransferase complex protein AlgI